MAESRFVVPVKRINDGTDFAKWQNGSTLKRYLSFVVDLSDAVKGKKISDPCKEGEKIAAILSILEEMDKWVDEIPPLQQPMRFGNKAFRTYHERLSKEAASLTQRVLPVELQDAALELGPYLAGGFGNEVRIDYGTGHEASFVAWLLCMEILGVLTKEDHAALVLRVIVRYLALMRKLQRTYYLEPAGSHGVWGLDDYQFLPFLWGASQLIGHPNIRPKSIHSKEIVEEYANEYLYLGCIKFINLVKKGPFGEHSPYLNDISYVPHQLWEKVNAGLVKMYTVEVLNKFVVIQHFLFGNILPFS